MKRLLLVFLTFWYSLANAQLANVGAVISVDQSGVLFVDGDVDMVNGQIAGDGMLVLTGNWNNHNTNLPAFLPNSQIHTHFAGASQVIAGYPTEFPTIFFNCKTMYLQTNVSAYGMLDLANAEVFTNANQLWLKNVSSLALASGSGLINTGKGGRFVWSTASRDLYAVPLGDMGAGLFRTLTIAPQSSTANTYAVGLEPTDASNFGYLLASKRESLKKLNNNYFYNVEQQSGNSATDLIFTLMQSEDEYNGLAQWENNRIWEKLPNTKVDMLSGTVAGGFYKLVTYNAQQGLGINTNVFTLAGATDLSNPLQIFNAFSPDGDGKNDKWEIKNIDAFPDNELKIYDRSGNLVYRVQGYNNAKAWDGTNARGGSYFYILRVNVNGEDKLYKGAITIVKN